MMMWNRTVVMVVASASVGALAGCAQTTGGTGGMIPGGGLTGAAAPAAPLYRPKIDMAAAPNGGADYEKHVAQCNSYVAQDSRQKGDSAMTNGALQGLANGVMSMWSGGFSGSSITSAMGNAAATGGTTMLREQSMQKAQAAAPMAPDGAEFIRTCMKSYGYKVTE
jgi:hypothetical protein